MPVSSGLAMEACAMLPTTVRLSRSTTPARPAGRSGMFEYIARAGGMLQPVRHCGTVGSLAGGSRSLAAAEWLEWTQDVGLHNVQLVDPTPNVSPSLRRLYWLAVLTWPAAFPLHASGLRSETQHGNMRGVFDEYHAFRRGLWFYVLLTGTAV